MLRYMRKHSRSWLTKFVFGIIILVFVFWGGSSYLARHANTVAKVDNHIISVQEYSKAYRNELRVLQERYGKRLDDKTIQQMHLKEKVLDDLVSDMIMDIEAKRLGIVVSDKEVAASIRNMKAFQTREGRFNEFAYKRLLAYYRLKPSEFETQQRMQILRNRLRTLVTSGVFLNPDEIKTAFHAINDSFDLAFVRINTGDFNRDIKTTPKEIEDYYKAHKEAYKIPPKSEMAYIIFDPRHYMGKVKVRDNEVRDYYESHKEQYSFPAQVRARVILVKLPMDASSNLVASKKKHAEDILKMAKSGKDFAALAREYSQDTASAKKGGDLGFLPKNKLPAGLDVLFKMKPGEIRGPIRSVKGFYVVKLMDKKDARERPFSAVKDQIREHIKLMRARDIAYDAADKASARIYEDPKSDIYAYAKANGLKVRKTGPFTEKDKKIPGGIKVASAVFRYPKGEISNVIDLGDKGYIVFKVTNRIAARIPPLEDVREKVRADLIKQKESERALRYAKHLASLGVKGVEKAMDGKIETTGLFKRSAWFVPKLGMLTGIKQDLNSLHTPRVYTAGNSVYVVWIKEKKLANPKSAKPEQMRGIAEGLMQEKKDIVFNAFMDQARRDHEIFVNKEKIL